MKKILTLICSCLLIFAFSGSNSFVYAQKDNSDFPLFSLASSLGPVRSNPALLEKERGADTPLASRTSNGAGAAATSNGVDLTAVPSFDFSRFLDVKAISSGDIISALKAVAVLAINLFLIIIQTIAGILKALLSFLQ